MTIAIELASGAYPDIGVTVSDETIYRTVYDRIHHDLGRDAFRCLHLRQAPLPARSSPAAPLQLA